MLGRIRWGSGRKTVGTVEQILGLPILTVDLPRHARRPERALRRGIALLRKNGVKRVLTPPKFPGWPLLIQAGLRPVDTAPLRRALAPAWVAAQLRRRDIPREQAVLRLSGEEREPALEGLARALCPLVRRLVFDLPGGNTAADRLRREMGLPVLPHDFTQANLTLRLRKGPVLTGAGFTLPGRELPADCDRLPLLSVLWETGRIKAEEIALKL